MQRKFTWRAPDRETSIFILFMTGMAVYYGWRMFALTPWYDELYTYYYFISRGPVYAAIHWPLPNNHIGFSVLSACLGILGNTAIALRGISYLCGLGSLVLLFWIGRKCFDHGMALVPVFLYAGMKMVNQLAVQGRGYSLVTFCYLAAVCELLQITGDKRDRIKSYAIFGMCLVMALYAIPSSVYVVVPLCLVGGVVLLLGKNYRRFAKLVLTSLLSAVCTMGLYGIVWLAIGSNLLMKTEGSMYYGMGHGKIIMHAPFAALKTGIDYMLATPYIQSVGREGFLGELANWSGSLLNEYYVGGKCVLAVLLITCVIVSLVCIIRRLKNGSYSIDVQKTCDNFMEIYLAVSILMIPFMLTVMCSLPYYRVFSFAGAMIALAVTWLWQMIVRYAGKCRYAWIGSLVCGILCLCMLVSPSYMAQYSDREAAIEDAYEQIDLSKAEKIGVTDCDQEYLLLFLYGIGEEKVTRQPEEAEVILADKYLLLGHDTDLTGWSGDDWKLYLTPEQFESSGVTEWMENVYENDRFVLYSRIEQE